MTEQDLIRLDNRVIDRQGNVVYFNDALVELLYNDIIPSDILYPEQDCDVKAFNKLSYENFDDVYYKIPTTIKPLEKRKEEWFYPTKYDEINLGQYFQNLLQQKHLWDKDYIDRTNLELQMFLNKGMEKFLRFCIYFGDTIRKNDLVVGVGRGSSVSSLLLFLLEIHLIDPIKYQLDIKEFLK